MSTGWIIYLSGVLAAFFIVRWGTNDDTPDWDRVKLRYLLPIFSWLTVSVLGIGWVYYELEEYFEQENPPKWL